MVEYIVFYLLFDGFKEAIRYKVGSNISRMARRIHRNRSRRGKPRVNKGILFKALMIQCVLLAVTVFVIVLDTPESEPPRFEGKASVAVKKRGLSGGSTARTLYETDEAVGADSATIGRLGFAQ